MSREGLAAAKASWDVVPVALPPVECLADLTLGVLLNAFSGPEYDYNSN